MEDNTLGEAERAVLEAIGDGRVTPETIESRLGSRLESPPADLSEQLAHLRENALLREAGDGMYELTENGERVLDAPGTGAADERIDTPDDVEATIESFDLPPDETAAVRAAFSFVRHWGEATTAEIVDGTYSEAPAGYDDADRWWRECVGDRLGSLPRLSGSAAAGPAAVWEFDGPAAVDHEVDRDGRAVLEGTDDAAGAGSVRRAIEEATRDPEERRAARAAFAALYERGSATTVELVEAASHLERDEATVDAGVEHGAPDDSLVVDHPSEHETAAAWAERLTELFAVLPGVDRELADEGSDEAVWSYDPGPRPAVSA